MIVDYAAACFAAWATPQVRALASRAYRNDCITPTVACRAAEEAERTYHATPREGQTAARRVLTHALARWYASLERAVASALDAASIPAPIPGSGTQVPFILQSDLDRSHALAARRRLVAGLRDRTAKRDELVAVRTDVLKRADKALIEYRRAQYQHERALLAARKGNPNAHAPQGYVDALRVAKETLDRARTERAQIRRAVKNANTSIRMLKHTHKQKYPLDSAYLFEV